MAVRRPVLNTASDFSLLLDPGGTPIAPVVAQSGGGSGGTTLGNLSLSTTSFAAQKTPGALLATINGKTAGSTVTISPSDTSGYFAVSSDGTQLLAGLSYPAVGATPTVQLREVSGGATNTPHDTTIASTITRTDTFLANVTTAPYCVFGAAKIVSSYAAGQKLYTLKNLTTSTTYDVLAASGNVPDYTGALAWAISNSASDKIVFSTWYDQLGSGKTFTAADATAPVWDPRQANGGIIPLVHDGNPSSVANLSNPVFMTCSGVSVNVQSMTVVDVLDPYFAYQRNIYWSMRASNNTSEIANIYASGNGGITFRDVNLGPQPRSQPSIISAVASTTACRLRVREQTYTSPNPYTTGTATYFYIGTATPSNPNDYYQRGRRWAWIVYPSELTDADVQTVHASLAAAFTIPTVFTSRLVIAGTSLAEGYLNQYAYSINQTLKLPSNVELFNVAVGGEALTAPAADSPSVGYGGFLAKFTPHVGNLFTSAYGAGKCALVIEHGSNDIGAYSTTGVTTMTAKAQAIAAAKALGYKTLATTIMPRNDTGWNSTMEAYRIDFNNRQRTNDGGTVGATGVADYIIDGASDPTLGDSAGVYPTAPVAGANWNTDKLHWTSAGAAIVMASKWRPQIAACLGFS